MKKPAAVTLLVAGNLLLTSGLGFASMALCFMFTGGFGAALAVLVLAAHVVGAMLLQRLYERREWLSPVKFWVCAAIPPAGVSLVGFVVVLYLDSIGYFSGYFAGLGEFLTALSGLIYSAAFLAALGLALCIKFRVSRALIAVSGLILSVGFGPLILIFCNGNLALIIPLALAHIAAALIIQHFAAKKARLSALRFWALFSAPAAVITGIPFLIETITRSGYDLFSITFVYALPAAAVLGVILLLKSLILSKSGRTE